MWFVNLELNQTQLAKDFIWEHLTPTAQDFFFNCSQMSEEERGKLFKTKRMGYLSKDGSVGIKEIAILTADVFHSESIGNSNNDPLIQTSLGEDCP